MILAHYVKCISLLIERTNVNAFEYLTNYSFQAWSGKTAPPNTTACFGSTTIEEATAGSDSTTVEEATTGSDSTTVEEAAAGSDSTTVEEATASGVSRTWRFRHWAFRRRRCKSSVGTPSYWIWTKTAKTKQLIAHWYRKCINYWKRFQMKGFENHIIN